MAEESILRNCGFLFPGVPVKVIVAIDPPQELTAQLCPSNSNAKAYTFVLDTTPGAFLRSNRGILLGRAFSENDGAVDKDILLATLLKISEDAVLAKMTKDLDRAAEGRARVQQLLQANFATPANLDQETYASLERSVSHAVHFQEQRYKAAAVNEVVSSAMAQNQYLPYPTTRPPAFMGPSPLAMGNPYPQPRFIGEGPPAALPPPGLALRQPQSFTDASSSLWFSEFQSITELSDSPMPQTAALTHRDPNIEKTSRSQKTSFSHDKDVVLRDLTEKISKLQKEVAALESDKLDLEATQDRLVKIAEEEKLIAEGAANDVARLKAQLAQLNEDLTAKSGASQELEEPIKEKEALESAAAEAIMVRKKLEEKLGVALTEQSKLQAQLSKVIAEEKSTAAKLIAESMKASQAEAAKAKVEKKLSETEMALKELTEQYEKTKAVFASVEGLVEAAKGETIDTQKQLDKIKKDHEDNLAYCSKLEEEIFDLIQQKGVEGRERDAAATRVEELEEENKRLEQIVQSHDGKDTVVVLEAKINELTRENMRIASGAQDRAKAIETRIKAEQDEKKALEDRCNALHEKLLIAKENKKSLEQEVRKRSDELEKNRKTIEHLGNTNQENLRLKVDLNAERTTVEQLRREKFKLKGDSDLLQKEKDMLKANLADVHAKMSKIQAELDDKSESLQHAETMAEGAFAVKLKLEEENKKLAKQVDTLQGIIKAMRDHEHTISDKTWDEERAALMKQISDLKKNLTETTVSFVEEKVSHKNMKESHVEILRQLKDANEALETTKQAKTDAEAKLAALSEKSATPSPDKEKNKLLKDVTKLRVEGIIREKAQIALESANKDLKNQLLVLNVKAQAAENAKNAALEKLVVVREQLDGFEQRKSQELSGLVTELLDARAEASELRTRTSTASVGSNPSRLSRRSGASATESEDEFKDASESFSLINFGDDVTPRGSEMIDRGEFDVPGSLIDDEIEG